MAGVLTDAELREFDELGLVRLPQAFSRDDARAMEESIWRFAERAGMVRDDPSTWLPGQLVGASPKLKRRPKFQTTWTEPVTSAIGQLLDGAWDGPRPNGLLVSFPTPGVPWRVPHLLWHPDYSLRHVHPPLFGVKTYGIINHIEPGGGATCVIAGSHRVLARFVATLPPEVLARKKGFQQANVRGKLMRSHPWLEELSRDDGTDPDRNARFFTDGDVDGCRVRVVELTGEPGDVYLSHPWTLHAIATNAGDRPRMMVSRNLYRRGVPFLPGEPDD